MYALWSAKFAEDQTLPNKYAQQPRHFTIPHAQLKGSADIAPFFVTVSFQQRAVLYLVYGEGASYEEAAEITGMTMLALMKQLSQGHLGLTHWLSQNRFRETAEPHAFGPAYENAGHGTAFFPVKEAAA